MSGPGPDTTIVIPVWGRYAGPTLAEAVDSLLAQDRAARIVVVDNASDVAVPAMPGIEVIRAPRRLTVGAARNFGLDHVRSRYVLFWDADDLMLPGTLAFLEDRLGAEQRVVAAAAAIVEDEPRVRHRWPPTWASRLARRRRAFALANAVWSMLPATGATLMRTAAVRESGGYADADSGEDWVLGVSLGFRGQVELHDVPGRVYRRRVGSLWERRRSTRHLFEHAAAVDRRLLTDPGVPRWATAVTPILAAVQTVLLLVRPLAKRLLGR